MYLKKITIQGFKSFARKTVIDFEQGITCIVGPNGSGKSNVSDAIKWVLGEKSMKNLRSKKSEDVIFAGSGLKSKSGMAEVSLFLDNKDKIVPIDFTEVLITRRIYRNGDSEYLINGSKARLLDLTELLSKSGFGRSTYTVIGQGMVDKLITQTTEERRELFQDASGVKHFYIKRDQALKKFKETKDNLTRVADVLRELKPRLSSLERKQKQAEERKVLTISLQDLQKKYYGSELGKINSSLSDQEKKFSEISENLTAIKIEVEKLNKLLEVRTDSSSRIKEQQQENQIRQTEQKLHDLQDKLLEKVRSDALSVEKLKNYREKLPKLKEELSILNKEIEGKKHQIEGLGLKQKEFNFELSKLTELKNKHLENSSTSSEPVIVFEKIKESLNSILKKIKNEKDYNFDKLANEISDLLVYLDKNDKIAFDNKATEKIRLDLKIEKIKSEIESRQGFISQANEMLGILEQKQKVISQEIEQIEGFKAKSIKEGNNIDIEGEIANFKKELEIKKNELAKIKEINLSVESAFLETEKAYRSKRDIESQYKDELTRVEIEITRLKTRKDDLEREVLETGLKINELKNINLENQQRQNIISEISSLKNKLAYFGGAISKEDEDEYREVKQRYEFLTNQSEDLSQALSSTKKVVFELERKIHDQFHEKFEKISQKFNQYFGKLFGGGQAKLILKEGETDEETTIDIQAIPPGKKVHTLSTLSGGEKSLTSIALLFAIFSVNPTPFCVLDEVDAALDESNSIRFADLLASLTNKTQFIVVTHNRETMKRSRNLYGVTMDEGKVSQVLSLRLEDAQQYSK